MTGETRKRKWGICFDPRAKVLLLIISMIIATTAPSLSYECALILLIAVMGILCGKVRYSIIGTIVFLVLYLFTTLYLGNVTGTAYTLFTAWLSLVFKVYPCGMLAGIAVSTTRVRGMRNYVAHEYGSIDLDVVWFVATNSIPELRRFCEHCKTEDSAGE